MKVQDIWIEILQEESKVKIQKQVDGLRRDAHGILGKLSPEEKRDWLMTSGKQSTSTGRRLRYEFHLSDGNVVSAEDALKSTNPEAYQRMVDRGINFRNSKGRLELFRTFPVEVQDDIVKNIPIEDIAQNWQRIQMVGPVSVLETWFKQNGHILAGVQSPWFSKKYYNQLIKEIQDLSDAFATMGDRGRDAWDQYWKVRNITTIEQKDKIWNNPNIHPYTKGGKFVIGGPLNRETLKKYGWRKAGS